MKISKLLESTQEVVGESTAGSTSSGSISSVSTPVGGMQRRGKGSMFAGIKTSAKYPNSEAVKEEQINEVDPRNFDSDVDYYAAQNAPAKPRYRGTSSPGVNPDDEAYFREIFRKKRLAAQQQERSADHDRLATGTNEGEEMGTFAALKDWQVWDVTVMNNYYRGKYADYGARHYSVVAGSAEEARQVVLNNPDYVLQDLLSRKLQSGKKVLPRGSALPVEEKRVGDAKPGSITTMGLKKMLTPDGVQSFKFTNGKIVDGSHMAGGEVEEARANTAGTRAGLSKRKTTVPLSPEEQAAKDAAAFEKWKAKNQKPEQTVDEASFDYTMKDMGNDYAGFPSNHSLKHKFLAKIKPEKQQLYKDKMNNMHEFDQLFQLFTVAKQRGDIIEQGSELSQPTKSMGLNASLEQHADDKMKELGPKFKGVAEGGYPDVDHMPGLVNKYNRTPAKPTSSKKIYTDKKQWLRDVDDINHSVHDDNSEYIGQTGRSTVEMNGVPWAVWSDAKQKGYIDMGSMSEEKQRLDPKCWSGYKKQGTKMKGDTRVNNCVKVDEAEFTEDKLANDLYRDLQIFKKGTDKDIGSKAKDKEISGKAKDKDIVAKEDWQKTNKSDKTDGMSPKAVKAYRRENPGSKLKTAVTKKSSELKAGSKDANRRKSFCARMSGNKGPMKDENGEPTPKAKALKRWNC